MQSAAQDLVKLTSSTTPEVPAKLGLTQYKAAVALVRAIGVEGTGVLIFVSGINDITEIVTMLEPYPKFLVFPIHSDIPADEQELAFGVTPEDKVKYFISGLFVEMLLFLLLYGTYTCWCWCWCMLRIT